MKIRNKKSHTTEQLKELNKMPDIGLSLGKGLIGLGYRKIVDLKGENPPNTTTVLDES